MAENKIGVIFDWENPWKGIRVSWEIILRLFYLWRKEIIIFRGFRRFREFRRIDVAFLIFYCLWVFMIVFSYHVTYTSQSTFTLYSCLNVKELFAQNRCEDFFLRLGIFFSVYVALQCRQFNKMCNIRFSIS